MKLFVDGDINAYYVQTLCMLFFPGAKFAENEPDTPDTPAVSLRLERTEGQACVHAHIRCAEGEADGEGTAAGRDAMSAKLAAGRAMLDAGRKIFGETPPWGMLTGVRPSKLAADCLARGMTVSEAEARLRGEFLVSPKKAALVTAIARREDEIIRSLGENTCSLYISIPFCPTRCAYCSFVSYSTRRLLAMIPDYLVRLRRDLKEMIALTRQLGQKIVTVYIGGGTPGILDETQLGGLLEIVRKECPDLLELTYEAGRPDTVTAGKLKTAKDWGVTRVSVNPQTLSDDVLDAIGRRHTAKQFYEAFALAKESGIPHINADLIAGLPGDSFRSFSRSLDEVIRLAPDNITVHTFCVKKSADILRSGSEIYDRSGGDTAKSVDYAQLATKNSGYEPYYIYRQKNTVGNFENVGFSRPGAEGLYNIFIMEEVHSIFAVGAGAVTKAVSVNRKNLSRFFMPKYPYEYLNAAVSDAKFEEIRRGLVEFYETKYR